MKQSLCDQLAINLYWVGDDMSSLRKTSILRQNHKSEVDGVKYTSIAVKRELQ